MCLKSSSVILRHSVLIREWTELKAALLPILNKNMRREEPVDDVDDDDAVDREIGSFTTSG